MVLKSKRFYLMSPPNENQLSILVFAKMFCPPVEAVVDSTEKQTINVNKVVNLINWRYILSLEGFTFFVGKITTMVFTSIEWIKEDNLSCLLLSTLYYTTLYTIHCFLIPLSFLSRLKPVSDEIKNSVE